MKEFVTSAVQEKDVATTFSNKTSTRLFVRQMSNTTPNKYMRNSEMRTAACACKVRSPQQLMMVQSLGFGENVKRAQGATSWLFVMMDVHIWLAVAGATIALFVEEILMKGSAAAKNFTYTLSPERSWQLG
jgi:hypothetical protein